MADAAKKEKAPKAEKKQPRQKTYLVVKYTALKQDTEKGKRLLASGGQAGLIYAACAKAKEPLTFAELLAAVAPALKGKKAETIENNARWYVNQVKKGGFIRTAEDKVQAKSLEEARGAEQ